MNHNATSRSVLRALRTELACARALLDGLEAVLVLDGESEERTQRDVVEQVADQLEQVATTMKHWKGRRAQDEV